MDERRKKDAVCVQWNVIRPQKTWNGLRRHLLSETGQSGRQRPMISLTCGILLKPPESEKETRFVRTNWGWGWGEGKLEGGVQKAHISSWYHPYTVGTHWPFFRVAQDFVARPCRNIFIFTNRICLQLILLYFYWLLSPYTFRLLFEDLEVSELVSLWLCRRRLACRRRRDAGEATALCLYRWPQPLAPS